MPVTENPNNSNTISSSSSDRISNSDSHPFPVFPPDFHFSTLDEACELTLLSDITPSPTDRGPLTFTHGSTPETYFSAFLPRDWCIGFVPHGGYIASLLTEAAMKFTSSARCLASVGTDGNDGLPKKLLERVASQVHPVRVQLDFLRKARSGESAVVRVRAKKLGGPYTVVGVSLYQTSKPAIGYLGDTAGSGSDRAEYNDELRKRIHHECCTGFITLTNILTEESYLSRPTIPLPLPVVAESKKPIPPRASCVQYNLPPYQRRWCVSTDKFTFLYPKPPPLPGRILQWIRWADYPIRRQGFTLRDLGFICDMYSACGDNLLIATGAANEGTVRWYPTLGYEFEVKTLPPLLSASEEAGWKGGGAGRREWEWLFVWAEMGEPGIKGGRMYEGVSVYDEEGELVARGGQMRLVLKVEANVRTTKRESKL